MNIYWIALFATLGSAFIAEETYALANRRVSLSHRAWNLSQAWPPLPFVAGLLVTLFAAHLWCY